MISFHRYLSKCLKHLEPEFIAGLCQPPTHSGTLVNAAPEVAYNCVAQTTGYRNKKDESFSMQTHSSLALYGLYIVNIVVDIWLQLLSSKTWWSIKLYFGCWLAVGSLVVSCLKLASSKPSNTAGFRLFRFLGRWHLLFGASFNPMTCGFPAIQSSYKSKQVANTFRTLS